MKIEIKTWLFLLLLPLSIGASGQQESETLSEEEQEYAQWATETLESLDPLMGTIKLPRAYATLEVPETFYFLDAQDAQTVLVDIWGNPPDQTTLGMLLPAGLTPFDPESWAVTIEYDADGYVSDEDAQNIDYDEMLISMQEGTRQESREREKEGYASIELVGWAAPPRYDSNTHKLYWAKELKFGEMETNTLNYNIRVLGRKGVLLMNFIAGIDQQPTIESNLDTVLALANFDDGSKYSDFDPDVDKVAAYGIGALVGGKILAKTGILAALFLILKKFGVFILLGIGAAFKFLFSRNKKPDTEVPAKK